MENIQTFDAIAKAFELIADWLQNHNRMTIKNQLDLLTQTAELAEQGGENEDLIKQIEDVAS